MVALLTVLVVAQPPAVDTRRLVGESEATARRVAEAEAALKTAKPADALDLLLRLQTEAGDDLTSTDGRHFVPARRAVQRLLATLPPPTLRSYRDRIAGPADALLTAGRRDHDPRPLRTLLDRYPLATTAAPARLLLGELLFERGEFREAEAAWRPLIDERARALVVLSLIFQGDTSRATAELDEFRKSHPSATGKLAGVDGKYADTLAGLLKNPPRRPQAAHGGDWTAFAGNQARDGRATGKLPRYWPTRPTWHIPFPTDKPPAAPTPTARSVPYHPVVLNGVGYVADPCRVFAFDPRTGAGAVAFDLRTDGRFAGLQLDPDSRPLTADADFTLTASDGKLYARLGVYPPPQSPDPANAPSDFLVCLVPGGRQLELRWLVPPPGRDGATVAWEAAPVVVGGRVLAAYSRVDGTTRTFGVAAYADPPGDKPLWTREVATAPAGAGPRLRSEPLTVAGGLVVVCTHAGSVTALDPASGKPAWAVKYPAAPARLAAPARDLCPPLASGGRVFVAPLDGDELMALDAATGKPLWTADGLATDQLLGVSRGRLVATIAGPHKGIRAFDAATGRDREPDGWRQHDDPQLGSFGRGLVTDELILWPTRQGLFPLSPLDGQLVAQPLPGPHGNLAFAGGVLLVGTPTGVSGFVPDGLIPNPSPRNRAVALLEVGKTQEAAELVRAAGLPDADRLAEWWGRPPPLPPPTGGPLSVADPPFQLPPPSPLAGLRVTATTRFPAPVAPLRPLADGPQPLLLVTDGPRVLAYRPREEAPAWATPLPAGLRVTHAAVLANDVLLVGPRAAVRLDRATGRVLWAWTPPDPRGDFRPARPPLRPTLGDFTLTPSRLVVRLGEQAVVALNLSDGRPAWALGPTGFASPTVVGFTHLACPDGRRLLVRRVDGKLLALDPVTGEVLATARTAAVPWDGPPVRVAPDLVAVADGPGRVTALDPSGRAAWVANAGGDFASFWGRPPQLKAVPGGLLLAVARTYGTELELVRVADGGRPSDWPGDPVFLGPEPADLSAADADATAVYVPDASHLTAVRLSDGRVRWRVPLPGPGRWRPRVGAKSVFLTQQPPADLDLSATARRFLRAPHAGRLPALLLAAYDAWGNRAVPLVRLDPATGQVLDRLDLPAGPVSGSHLGPGPAVVVAGTVAHWLN